MSCRQASAKKCWQVPYPPEHDGTTLDNDDSTLEHYDTTLYSDGTILWYDGLAFEQVKVLAITPKSRTVVLKGCPQSLYHSAQESYCRRQRSYRRALEDIPQLHHQEDHLVYTRIRKTQEVETSCTSVERRRSPSCGRVCKHGNTPTCTARGTTAPQQGTVQAHSETWVQRHTSMRVHGSLRELFCWWGSPQMCE